MTKINRSVRPFTDIAEFIAQETAAAADDFHAAFASNLEGIRIGRDEEEMATDMPDPREAQLAVELIVTTLFDVLRDSRLQPAAERLAWGIVNSFHHVADQWAGQADKATRDVQDLLQRADGSEIHAVELEQARDNLEFLDEATDALRCMRDHAADVFHTETGRPWSAPKGSLVSSKRTASVIAATDFLAARRQRRTDAHNPQGPIVIFSGGADTWFDKRLIWGKLDEAKARNPMMLLATTAQDKGCDAMAAAWAASRKVKLITFRLSAKLGKRAGFVRNEQMVGLRPVEALVCEGSGLQSHLARLVKEKRIPARFVRLSDQEWEAQ
ncbi:DUF2493 domain-containing protein [Sphingobium sp. H39-3-25]|uniref:DUF2493 domain-containing protein n=1 Tax=Sphingobium arseniciresistens TaxID=3030834 RepID=UPI0023B8DEFF|nr:DUF2493 domain-containing protein [Sphingobium arseniciresistens]|tara:strand:+ start:162 stop:1142 length:981 start_codon:yes stop_codon:yes gene_type:complete